MGFDPFMGQMSETARKIVVYMLPEANLKTAICASAIYHREGYSGVIA